jgi:predicted cupin superfamily sugar epimerase
MLISRPSGTFAIHPKPTTSVFEHSSQNMDLLVPTLDELLKRYDWFDHPDGPRFVETHRDRYRTSGHWLFVPGVFSAFHRVKNCDELWIAQIGCVVVHILNANGSHVSHRIGMNLSRNEVPVVSIPKGAWQAAELAEGESFAFGTNVCAPGFDFNDFSIASCNMLLAEFPSYRELITRLTRSNAG